MSLDVGIVLCFAVSLGANILLAWWGRRMWQGTLYVEDGVRDLLGEVGAYSDHLQEVYEMPTFYGDTTLEGLLQHTNDIRNQCSEFVESFSLDDEVQIPEKVEDVNEREQQPPQA
jgi:hypothetical protein